MFNLLDVIFYAVAAVLAIGAIVNAVGPPPLPAQYVRWGYPENFRFVTAALEATALMLMLSPGTRTLGLLLAALVMIAAVATLLRAKELPHAIPAAAIFCACVFLLTAPNT